MKRILFLLFALTIINLCWWIHLPTPDDIFFRYKDQRLSFLKNNIYIDSLLIPLNSEINLSFKSNLYPLFVKNKEVLTNVVLRFEYNKNIPGFNFNIYSNKIEVFYKGFKLNYEKSDTSRSYLNVNINNIDLIFAEDISGTTALKNIPYDINKPIAYFVFASAIGYKNEIIKLDTIFAYKRN